MKRYTKMAAMIYWDIPFPFDIVEPRQQKLKNLYKFKQSFGGMFVRYLGQFECDGKEIKTIINQNQNNNKC